jgi:hypothetical protein
MQSIYGLSRYTIAALALFAGLIGFAPGNSLAKPPGSVDVINTDDNPAITSDVNSPGRAPYQSITDQSGKCSSTLCSFTFTAPASHRIVVKNVSGVASVTGTLTQLSISVDNSSGALITGFQKPPTQNAVSHAFNEPVLFYIDPGDHVTVFIFLAGGATFVGAGGGAQSVTLTGIAVDCSVSSGPAARPYCAPIIH